MTIPSNVTRNSYTGTGITGPYPVTFKFFEDADLKVTVADTNGVETVKVLTTDYAVTGAGEQAGGSITFTTAVTTGYSIVIEPKADLTQDTDIKNEGGNLRESIEDRFDRLCRDDQVQQNLIDRSIKVQTTDLGAVDSVLPPREAGALIGWNDTGTGFANRSASLLAQDAPVTATGSTTARWLSDRFAEVANVRDYGAVGDGITDDTAAIQAAIDSVPGLSAQGLGGGVVVFPAGSYRVIGVLTISESGLTLKGAGTKASAILCENGGTSLTYSDTGHTDVSVGRFQMEDIGIRAFGDAQNTGIGTSVTSAYSCTFKNVEWYNFNRNLKLFNCYSNTFLNCHHFTCPVAVTLDNACVGNSFIGGTMRLTSVVDQGQNSVFAVMDWEPGNDNINQFGSGALIDRCYFELATTGSNPWIRLNSYSTLRNSILAWSVSARPSTWLIEVVGSGNTISDLVTSYSERVIKFVNTSYNNTVRFNSFHLPVVSGNNQYAFFPVLDLGSGNRIEWSTVSDASRSEEDGNGANLTRVFGNRVFSNLVRTHAENDLQQMTSALTVDIKDPFNGTAVYKDTVVAGAYGVISNNPVAATGDGTKKWTMSVYIYVPTGSTMTAVMPFGAYANGMVLNVADIPRDKWIRMIHYMRPPNGTGLYPGIYWTGPAGAVGYHAYMTLYEGENPGVPAAYLTDSTREKSW